ncbi:MAG TPA: hypothetical protein ENK85_00710, partial [Saprospiraceae bacterium]|nr:hypothetical protein [Saprospiraceae bacterium]
MNNAAKLFLILLVFGLHVDLFAQIDPELLLELKKGTTAEMNAITPAKGVLLYNTDDDKVYRFDGTSWASMGDDGDWTRNGNDQYSAVSGNVGIGTNNPQRLLHLSQDYPSGLTTLALENTNTTNGNSSIISFRTKTNGAGGTDFLETAAISAKYQEHNHASQSTDLMLWAKEAGVWSNAVLKGSGDFGIGTTKPIVHLSNNTSSIPANLEISTTGKTGIAGRTDLALFSDLDGSNPANIFLQGKLSTGKYGWATWSFRGNHSLAEYKDWVDFGLNDGTTTKEQVMRMNVLNGDVVFNEGNVGIGITSPTTKLHVMGDIQLGGSDKRLIRFRNLADNDHASIGELNGGLVLSGHAAANVAGSEHLFINNQGNVGIGTISPSGKLHVSSGTEGDAKLIIEADTDDNNEDDNPLIVFKQDGGLEESAIEQTHNELHIKNSVGSGGGLVFDIGTTNGYANATEAMRIIPDGKIGLGTSTPSEKLDIQGNVAHSGQLRSRGPNYTNTWMKFAEHEWGNSTILGAGGNTILGGGEFSYYAQPNFSTSDETLVLGSDGNIQFFTNTQNGWNDRKNVMTMTSTSRVGVNTPSPSTDLDVNGQMRIRNIPAGS